MVRILRTRMIVFVLTLAATVLAQQSTDFIITDFPVGIRTPKDKIWIKWTGAISLLPRAVPVLPPDSGVIYFDRFPGGGALGNYRYKVKFPVIDTNMNGVTTVHNNEYFNTTPAQRGIQFQPQAQDNMDAGGVYYCVVGYVVNGVHPITQAVIKDTLVSNEVQIVVEKTSAVKLLSPTLDTQITALTPTFRWESNGVPYYHVILSDDSIAISQNGDSVDLQGLSIIWQAITPNTQIVYGAPDPSGTITAAPPPLSPGQRFTWMVLNNYANHPAYSSPRPNIPPGAFKLLGDTMSRPVPVAPTHGDSLESVSDSILTFRWTNLDPRANTYKIYVYVASSFAGIGAQLVVWENEVSAASFVNQTYATASVNAKQLFTTNKYVWKVIAVSAQGAGSTGDTSSFQYRSTTGVMSLRTKEIVVSGGDTLKRSVGLVQMKVEVLEGSMEAPLLFYSDTGGVLVRERPTGTYRVTAVKQGFEDLSRTMTIGEGDTIYETFYMRRPESSVYGQILDPSGSGINLAIVTGTSDQGDTTMTQTDALGNFVTNCSGASWTFTASKSGYIASIPRTISVQAGESFNYGKVTLNKNPLTISGITMNPDGKAVLGAQVQLLRDDQVVDQLPSTPQDGSFAFSVSAGRYKIIANKTGFVSYETEFDLTSSRIVSAVLQPNAALVTGSIVGMSWVGSDQRYSAIRNAKILFVTTAAPVETTTVFSGATYGDFRASLGAGKQYRVIASAKDFVPRLPYGTITPLAGNSTYSDTMVALGMVQGVVRNGAATGMSGVLVSLLSAAGSAVASGVSDALGAVEITGIPNGTYTIVAGREGVVVDSIRASDIITFSSGRTAMTTFTVHVSPGTKTIAWKINGGSDTLSEIKVQVPLQKTVFPNTPLLGMGKGNYVVTVRSASDTVLDLVNHTFTVAQSESLHVENMVLPVYHHADDSLAVQNGKVTIVIRSDSLLDSAAVFYKDINAVSFVRTGSDSAGYEYRFEIVPSRDGSTLRYYFNAFRGADVYGYEYEVYSSYIRPDSTRLSKFEVVPSSADTLTFPLDYTATFGLKGYYSSSFIPAAWIKGRAVSWALLDAPAGCTRLGDTGLTLQVRTGSVATSVPVRLVVTLDTAMIPLRAGLSNRDTVLFNISTVKLNRIAVRRIDANNPNPVLASTDGAAEFVAEGMSKDSVALSVSPQWEIFPTAAGSISALGVFKPKLTFSGVVRITARSGSISGSYQALRVQYMVSQKSRPDTVTNGQGCSIILPANLVSGGDVTLMDITMPVLANAIQRGTQNLHVVGSAFEISLTSTVALRIGSGAQDSIRLTLDVPEMLQQKVSKARSSYGIALWDADSLEWDSQDGALVAVDGSKAALNLSHFSQYALVSTGGSLGAEWSVSPNPFSPYVKPRSGSKGEFGSDGRYGACISFTLDDAESNLRHAWVRIYSVMGDLAYSVKVDNAERLKNFRLWWDGKTTDGTINVRGADADDNGLFPVLKTSRMCRNGRYVAVLSVRNYDGTEKHFTKPVILIK